MAGSRKTVLWVDDEIEFLRAHIMFLETRGYSVIPVFTGDDAIHLIQEGPARFDIVLLDEQMPGKDGLTTLQEIKQLSPDLPVVMVTKSEEEQVMEDALGMKIDGYLTKPVNPSQILSVCKRLLDYWQIVTSRISQRFVRSFSEIRTRLSSGLDAWGWSSLYEELVRWDLELEKIEDEGIRQTHAGQKSDANAAFSQFVVENYPGWVRGREGVPPMISDVAERVIYPRLARGERTALVVLEGLRLDQYLGMERLLRRDFGIETQCYYSVLPTSPPFSRHALFAGMLPLDIAERYPKTVWGADEDEDSYGPERGFLAGKLRDLGSRIKRAPRYVKVDDSESAGRLLNKLPSFRRSRFFSIVVNMVDLLTQSRSESNILREIAPDETAFRSLTQSWFQYSTLLQIIRKLGEQKCTVVLASDHGSVFCTRSTELYGSRGGGTGRFRLGKDITCDERYAVHLSDPAVYGLPPLDPETVWVIARENYHFSAPENFKEYSRQYRTTFQHGGISMEEMIVPVAILRPKREG